MSLNSELNRMRSLSDETPQKFMERKDREFAEWLTSHVREWNSYWFLFSNRLEAEAFVRRAKRHAIDSLRLDFSLVNIEVVESNFDFLTKFGHRLTHPYEVRMRVVA